MEVTLLDANHCPGAALLLFRLPDGRRLVHTGDLRHTERFLSCPHLAAFRGAEALYLDTTYCNPKFKFAAQEESVAYVASTLALHAGGGRRRRRGRGRQRRGGGGGGRAAGARRRGSGR